MKKIGILTFHRSYNYGAFMQCYALVNRLKTDFPNADVEVIDYTTRKSYDSYRINQTGYNEETLKKIEARNRLFDEAQNIFLPLSEYSIISDEYEELFNTIKGRYDIIVTGSDAVWNWNNKGFPNAYFLCRDTGAKRMSFAASAHGMDYKKMTGEQRSTLKECLRAFEYIGVREETTAQMVRYADETLAAHRNCDPTVLLDVEKIPVDMAGLKKKLSDRGIDFSKPVIGLMASEPYGEMIKKYFKNSVQIAAVYQPNRNADVFLYDLTPLEWSRVFALFDVTVTHFFHGTMLSLRNLTPVIPIEPASDYNIQYTTKIKNALHNMEMEDYYRVLVRKKTFVNRALRKIKLDKDQSFWYEICRKIEQLIENPQAERIGAALKTESETYGSFRDDAAKILGD